MIRYLSFVTCIALAFALPFYAMAADEEHLARGREAVKALGSSLKHELQQAMQTGGALAAITVCNEKAPKISAALSGEKHMDIGRTALRLRNPTNAPDDWEREQLETFMARLSAGEDAKTMEAYDTQDGMFRYMKAIPMQGMCTTCHGQTIPKKLKKQISALYPEDEATGFKAGELRGAFTVSIPIAESTND